MADYDSSDYLSSTSNTSYDPSTDTMKDLGSTNYGSDFYNWLQQLSGGTGGTDSLLKSLGAFLGGTSSYGQLGSFLGSAGIGALLNRLAGSNTPAPVGYQGGIPQYTVNRTQTPLAQQRPAGYRPGQGGITYFNPTQYTATGKDLAAPVAGEVSGGGVSGGLGELPLGPNMRPSAFMGGAADAASRAASLNVPAAGTPERAAYEQRLASQMTPAEFDALKANPFSVLSPSFGAALQANLAGQEELRRLGMTSQFGTNLSSTATPQDIQNYFTALQIERPTGGQITENRDLNTLMTRYLDSLESGDVGGAFAARNRMLSLGVNPQNLDTAKEILRPGISDKAYYQYYDPSNPQAQGLPIDIAGKGSDFSWEFIASQKQKYGLTDDQIAYALGMSPEEVKRSLPLGAAHGGAMPSGIAMLAKGRYIQGNGDGVSDSVPAKFVGSGRPAALSDGEFVFPARIVAELGNGSNEAGAKKLYAFMDRVEAKARSAKRGKPSGADNDLNRLA